MKKDEIANILIVCGDPGGASAVAPVIKELGGNQSIQVHVFAYFKSTQVFQDENILFTILPDEIPKSEITDLFTHNSFDLLLTGTSENQFNLEKDFISIANDLEIPSLTVLDFWSNYSNRFSRKEGALDCLPTKIAIMDQLAHSEMEQEGIPADRLVITGQPGFDRLKSMREQFTDLDRLQISEKIGIPENEFSVLFISQPFSKLFGESPNNKNYPGYDEKKVARHLCNSLEQAFTRTDVKINLIILPHLREEVVWWDDLNSEKINIVSSKSIQCHPLILSADIVLGLTSTKLVEASILGLETFSLQIGAFTSKYFDMEKLGITKNIYSLNELLDVIGEKIKTRGIKKSGKEYTMNDYATEKVLNLIDDLLDGKIRPSLNNQTLRMEVS